MPAFLQRKPKVIEATAYPDPSDGSRPGAGAAGSPERLRDQLDAHDPSAVTQYDGQEQEAGQGREAGGIRDPAPGAHHARAPWFWGSFDRISRSSLSWRFSRRIRVSPWRSAVLRPSGHWPSSHSACETG